MSIKKELEKLGEKITNKDIQGGTKEKLLKSIRENYEGGAGESAIVFEIGIELFTQILLAYQTSITGGVNEGVTLTEGTIVEQAFEVANRIKEGECPQVYLKTDIINPEDPTQRQIGIFQFQGTNIVFTESGEIHTEVAMSFQEYSNPFTTEISIEIDNRDGTPKATVFFKQIAES